MPLLPFLTEEHGPELALEKYSGGEDTYFEGLPSSVFENMLTQLDQLWIYKIVSTASSSDKP